MCMFRPPITQQTRTVTTSMVETVDRQWLSERLHRTGAIPPEGLASNAEWNQWYHQCRYIPEGVWRDLRQNKIAFYLTRGKPLTTLPHLAHLAGHTQTYPDGRVFRWEDIPGYGDPSVRLDMLGNTSSVALVPHEVGHAVDIYLLKAAYSPEWLDIHTKSNWWDIYTRTQPGEAWAESFACFVTNLKPLTQLVWDYFNRIFKQRNWGVRFSS